jgi:hypothetical protein
MTHRAFGIRVVLVRIDAPDLCPSAGGIGQRVMAPQTLCPGPVDRELGTLLGIVFAGSIVSGTMAVFAHDDLVGGLVDTVVLIRMTILAVFFTPVLYFYDLILPLFFIAQPMPAVHIAAFTCAEILRYIEGTRNEE